MADDEGPKWVDLFGIDPEFRTPDEKLPALNCPKCGRFARVTMRGQDHEGSWWFDVHCKQCGPRRVW